MWLLNNLNIVDRLIRFKNLEYDYEFKNIFKNKLKSLNSKRWNTTNINREGEKKLSKNGGGG